MADKKLMITSIEDAVTDGVKDTLDLTEEVAPKTPEAHRIPKAIQIPEAPVSHASLDIPTALNNTPDNIFDEAPSFTWVRTLTIVSVLVWLLVVAGLLFAVLKIGTNWQSYSPLQWVTVIALILGPALLIFIAAYSLKQLARITTQSFALTNAANALTSPDEAVVGKSQIMAEAVSSQVDQVNEKLNAALGRLSSMDDVVGKQTAVLATANQSSRDTIDMINASVETQKTTINAMTNSLDESMVSLSNTLTMHTDNLAKSVQIAEQKIKEARISVEGATAKINTASDIVRSNTVQASATLSASHEDIKSLGDIIRLRSEELDQVYKKHAGELTAMIEHLRDEQISLGASMEERLVKMRDLSLSAQASAESLSNASKSGKETIEALAAAASLADGAVKTRFSEMRDMVEYSTEHAQSISDMAAKRVQDSLELTRKEIIRIEQEMAELQTRIGNKKPRSLELVPDDASDDISDDEPEETSDKLDAKPKAKKRKWTRLKLKPVIDIEPIEAIVDETIEELEIPEPNLDLEIDNETFEPKAIAPEPIKQAPLVLGDNLIEPDMIRQSIETLEPVDIPVIQIDGVTQLVDTSTNKVPKMPPAPQPTQTDETIRRAAPLDDVKRSKPKSNTKEKSGQKSGQKTGLFRGLFGGRSDTSEPSSLDIVGSNSIGKTAPEPLSSSPPPTDDELIIADLAQLGLSANAIVDEGCIIEATNMRVSSGHEAMSRCVAERLKNPVEHLVKSLAVNDDLSDKAIIFATRYDRTLEMLAGNREAIRTRLESEKGRAYLLCDAALNYGRV